MSGVFKFIKDVAAPALIAFWAVWLLYGALAGAAGYGALKGLRETATQKSAELAELRERRELLERRADLLNPKSLDPDMVDERVRAVLGYADARDLVIPKAELDRMLADRKSSHE